MQGGGLAGHPAALALHEAAYATGPGRDGGLKVLPYTIIMSLKATAPPRTREAQ